MTTPVIGTLVGALLLLFPAGDTVSGFTPNPFEGLPQARVITDSTARQMIIELPPVDVPARPAGSDMSMVLLPVYTADMGAGGSLFAAHVELVDAFGNELPRTLLHHFNLTDPTRRELFVGTSLHMLAASKETPPLEVPRFVFGVPVHHGQRLLASAMLGNETNIAYHDVRVRAVLHYEPEHEVWPIFGAYPWVMDVLFPLGHPPDGSKAFDLPPGHSEHSYESSPAVPGTIVAVGGHLHDYGVTLELTDVTTGTLLWHATPVRDSAGHVLSIPVGRFYNWHSLGVHVLPTHRYRVTAVYDNPTGHLLVDGGMGAIGGLFIPDRGVVWPAVDPNDSVYQGDLAATLRNDMPTGPMMMSGMH
jgi:hypothetical protein